MSAGKFPLGQTVITANAAQVLSDHEVAVGLARHMSGDWGDLDAEDKRHNDTALREGLRLLSAYRTVAGIRYWIITEHDRSATTILLPEDY